jgi:hypothetical protein
MIMESRGWFVHVEWVVVLITLLGGFYLLDGKIERNTAAQSARSDRLYEMFIDLLKETKCPKQS